MKSNGTYDTVCANSLPDENSAPLVATSKATYFKKKKKKHL